MEGLSPSKFNSMQKKKRPSAVHSATADSDSVDLTKLRAHAACKNCRVKKVKCLPLPSSSVDPSAGPGPCQQCVAAGSECVYPPTRDRAAYSRQYVQNLEARVQALEGVWGRIVPVLEAFEGGSSGLLGGGTSNGGTSHPPIPMPTLPAPMQDDDDDEDGASDRHSLEDGQITQDERGNYRWIGSSNTLSLLDSFSGQPLQTPLSSTPHTHTPDRNPYFGPVAGSGVVKALPGVDEVSYPTHRAAREMVDAFFSDVHPTLPVVIEYEFRQEFDALMDRRSRGEVETSSQTFVSVLFAVFALGERVVVTNRAWQRARSTNQGEVLPGEAEAGVIWYERAQILHYTTLKDVNLHQIQCLTLMAAFQASVNAMPTAWLLAGQAIRVAQDLGLHRHNRVKMSYVERQLKARCWWAIYGLERMVSIALGRPLGVDDLDIDVGYPSEIDDDALQRMAKDSRDHTPETEAHGSTMSGFVALTKLCKIAGRVAHLLYRPSNKSIVDPHWAHSQQTTINKLDKSLRDWLANEVPSKYKDPSSNRSVQLVSAVLSNSYFAVLITLHRNFLPSNPDYPRPKPVSSSQSLSHCVDAARSVIHVASQSRVLVPPSHHLAVFCQFLWSSAVILLLCEVQAKDQVVIEAVGAKVQSCRRALQDLEPVWPGSRKLKELLNDVETRAKEVVHDPKKRKFPSPDKKPRQSSIDKRSRIETSDARSNSNLLQHDLSQYQSQHHGQGQNQNQMMETVPIPDMSMFDIGGVTFDGLEMLQGFQGVDPANIWSTLGDTFIQTPAVVNTHSGNGTPNSAQGPSPGGWAFQQGNLGFEGTDLWSQVAGGSFDWQADPSVPFNI